MNRLCPDGLYSYAVDIWSCGCILAELLNRNPLFPGKNFVHQLSLVFDVIGTPSPADVQHIVNSEAKKFLKDQGGKRKVPFTRIFPQASTIACDLLERLLIFDPERRITCDEALASSYLNKCNIPICKVFPPVSSEFEFSFERQNLSRTQLKQLIHTEVNSMKREKFGSRGVPPSSGPVNSKEANGTNTKEKTTTNKVDSDSFSTSSTVKRETNYDGKEKPMDGTKNTTSTTNTANNTTSGYARSTTSSASRSQSAPKMRPSNSGSNLQPNANISNKSSSSTTNNNNLRKDSMSNISNKFNDLMNEKQLFEDDEEIQKKQAAFMVKTPHQSKQSIHHLPDDEDIRKILGDNDAYDKLFSVKRDANKGLSANVNEGIDNPDKGMVHSTSGWFGNTHSSTNNNTKEMLQDSTKGLVETNKDDSSSKFAAKVISTTTTNNNTADGTRPSSAKLKYLDEERIKQEETSSKLSSTYDFPKDKDFTSYPAAATASSSSSKQPTNTLFPPSENPFNLPSSPQRKNILQTYTSPKKLSPRNTLNGWVSDTKATVNHQFPDLKSPKRQKSLGNEINHPEKLTKGRVIYGHMMNEEDNDDDNNSQEDVDIDIGEEDDEEIPGYNPKKIIESKYEENIKISHETKEEDMFDQYKSKNAKILAKTENIANRFQHLLQQQNNQYTFEEYASSKNLVNKPSSTSENYNNYSSIKTNKKEFVDSEDIMPRPPIVPITQTSTLPQKEKSEFSIRNKNNMNNINDDPKDSIPVKAPPAVELYGREKLFNSQPPPMANQPAEPPAPAAAPNPKKKLTVPKSPKFSTMSWQKRMQEMENDFQNKEIKEKERKAQGDGYEKKRYASTGRTRTTGY